MSDNRNIVRWIRSAFGFDRQSNGRGDPLKILVPLVSIALALILGMVVIAVSGRDPFEAYALLFGDSGLIPGSASWKREFAELLLKTALYSATGLSIAMAFKAGLFNIGAEGQFWVGAVAATFIGYWGPFAHLPRVIHPAVCILFAMLAGGCWAALAGYLKVKRGVNEVIGTIMLNWTAWFLITGWLVLGPMAPIATKFISGTYYIAETAKLTRIMPPTRLNTSILIALVAAYATWFLLYKTTIGYEIRAIGHTAVLGMEAPRAQGINVNKRIVQAMFLAGALSGLGGAFFILGLQFQFPNTAIMGYGWTGIGIALIGQGEPFGVILSSLFIAALRTGATSMQVAGIPKTFSNIIEGLAVGFIALQVAVRFYVVRLLERRRLRKAASESKEAV